MESNTLEALGIAALVGLSAVYSGMEIALVNLSDVKLRARIESGEKLHPMLRRWAEKPNDVLATLLIGNNLVNILASALATDLTARMLADGPNAGFGIPIAVGLTTLLVLIVGEVVPKTFAKHQSERYLKLLPIVHLTDALFIWVRVPLVWATQSILRGVNAEVEGTGVRVTEEDIEEMVRLGELDGSIDPEATRLLTGVLELDDKVAREIMVPRTDMVALSADTSARDVLETVREAGFSRYPVYEDNVDEVVGVLYVKDLLSALADEDLDALTLRALMRPPFVVPENMLVADVLVAMKRERVHLAVVASEYGGVAGIVAMEDIVEEVFGPIYDEHDVTNEEFHALADGSWVVDGSYTLGDLVHELKVPLEVDGEGDFETVAGLLMHLAGKVPESGFVVEQDDVRFEVLAADATKVTEVRVSCPQQLAERAQARSQGAETVPAGIATDVPDLLDRRAG